MSIRDWDWMDNKKEMKKSKFDIDPNANAKYKLVRERDGLTKYGQEMGWIKWNEDGRFEKKHNKPAVGRSCILDPHRISYTWLTTAVTEIVEEREDYIKFKIENSNYELFKINNN